MNQTRKPKAPKHPRLETLYPSCNPKAPNSKLTERPEPQFLKLDYKVQTEAGLSWRYDRLGNINKQKELLERALAINEREYGALPVVSIGVMIA